MLRRTPYNLNEENFTFTQFQPFSIQLKLVLYWLFGLKYRENRMIEYPVMAYEP